MHHLLAVPRPREGTGRGENSLAAAALSTRKGNGTQGLFLVFSLNFIWQKWITWPPVATRDTGQVAVEHFSHWHRRLALPGRKKRRLAIELTPTGLAHTLTQVRAGRSSSHFRQHVPAPTVCRDALPCSPWCSNTSAMFLKEQVNGCQKDCWQLWNWDSPFKSLGNLTPFPEAHLSLRSLGRQRDFPMDHRPWLSWTHVLEVQRGVWIWEDISYLAWFRFVTRLLNVLSSYAHCNVQNFSTSILLFCLLLSPWAVQMCSHAIPHT